MKNIILWSLVGFFAACLIGGFLNARFDRDEQKIWGLEQNVRILNTTVGQIAAIVLPPAPEEIVEG